MFSKLGKFVKTCLVIFILGVLIVGFQVAGAGVGDAAGNVWHGFSVMFSHFQTHAHVHLPGKPSVKVHG